MTQKQSGPVRPAPQRPVSQRPAPRSEYTAGPWIRIRQRFQSFLRGIPRDVWRILIAGLVVVILAGFAQAKWPNGFPLAAKQASAAAVSQVYASGPVRLNEVMTANSRTVISSDGISADWAEIINAGSSAVNLKGYSLAKTGNGAAFTFPDCTLQPGQCALVFCDGLQQLQHDDGSFHAPFRLSADGDSLMLFNPSGTAIDIVNIPALGTDVSYIRAAATEWRTTSAATPGLENTQANFESRMTVSVSDVIEITEVMASNASYAPDFSGEFSDYIELHNTSGSDVDLKGYCLSDDVLNPMRWRFPDVTLPAGQYLLVYASGKNTRQDGELHTNFRLRSENEKAVLANPAGQIIQIVDYGILKSDQAYSRLSGGDFTTALIPSPGAPNPQ